MPQDPVPDIPATEVSEFAEFLNALDITQRAMFGDLINAAIVRNVKAAELKGQSVGVRGLARVIGLQPSTLRRRIAALVDAGWLDRDAQGGVHYSDIGRRRGAPAAREGMLQMAQVLRKLGWVNLRPPS